MYCLWNLGFLVLDEGWVVVKGLVLRLVQTAGSSNYVDAVLVV